MWQIQAYFCPFTVEKKKIVNAQLLIVNENPAFNLELMRNVKPKGGERWKGNLKSTIWNQKSFNLPQVL